MGLDLAERWGGGGRFRYHSLGKGMASPQGEPVQLRTQQVCHLTPLLLTQPLLWSFRGLKGKPGMGWWWRLSVDWSLGKGTKMLFKDGGYLF